jgi:hypothetical protein
VALSFAVSPLFTALAIQGAIGVHVETHEDVASEETIRIAHTFAAALTEASGAEAIVDDALFAACGDDDRSCTTELIAHLGVESLVLVRLYGARTKLLLLAERLDRGVFTSTRAEAELDRVRGIDPPLRALAKKLYPTHLERRTAKELIPIQRPIAAERPAALRIVPWATLGASAVAFAAGLGFGIASANARRDLQQSPDEQRIDALMSQVTRYEHFANGFYLGAAVLLVSSIVIALVLD